MGWRIGVDIGGTFTDVAMIDEESGSIGIAKVPTTTQDITEGVTSGLREGLARYDTRLQRYPCCRMQRLSLPTPCSRRTAPKRGFVTTRGFRDVLELRRSSRTDAYDLFQDGPGGAGAAPVALRDHRAHRRARELQTRGRATVPPMGARLHSTAE